MSNQAPERIWIDPDNEYAWWGEVGRAATDTEYVRADLLPQWIPVSERLPPLDSRYLICGPALAERISWFDENGWDVVNSRVTHWMPLPEPPGNPDE